MATKNEKKVAAPKPAKVAKPAKEKAVKKVSNVKFIAFRLRAVIPTQAYGNIQPEIEVSAPTYEEARDFAIPHIEALYKRYAEAKPTFLGKVVETVKMVAPAPVEAPTAPKEPLPTPSSASSAEVSAPSTSESPAPSTTAPKSEAVLKAEKAISLAMTHDAALLIQDQIEKSVKIAPEDKPALITLVLHKRNELKDK